MRLPVYLDNNATTPVDAEVLAEMQPLFSEEFGNPASQTHASGWYAAEVIAIARERVAGLLSASTDSVIFTSGATEANNLAIFGRVAALHAQQNLSQPLRVLATPIEHRSVLEPLQELARRRHVELRLLKTDTTGRVDPQHFQQTLEDSRALLACVMLANNEIGTLQDIPALSAMARKAGCFLHCDATQAFGKVTTTLEELGVDSLSMSAHKMYGPKGIGALVLAPRAQHSLQPLFLGGGHEHNLRAGTLATPLIAGFGKACQLAQLNTAHWAEHTQTLSKTFLSILSENGISFSLNGPPPAERLPGNLNLAIPGLDTAKLFGSIATKIAISASSACSSGTGSLSHVLQALGVADSTIRSCLRIGFGKQNSLEETLWAAQQLCASIRATHRPRSTLHDPE